MKSNRYVEGNLVRDCFEYDIKNEVVFRKRFAEQKKRGIHLNDYEDDVWVVSNGQVEKRINFSRVQEVPQNYFKQEYIKHLKNFVVGKIDANRNADGVVKIAKDIIAIGNATRGFSIPYESNVSISTQIGLKEFFEEIELSLDFLDELSVSRPNSSQQRDLTSIFYSYYCWEEEMLCFWEEADDEQKIVFGPLYLFWRLCNIIPTRPVEFCVMPAKCVTIGRDGCYYIRVRKSNRKGTGKVIENVIESDYPVYTFRINKDVGEDFLWYEKMVENDVPSDARLKTRFFNNVAFNRLRRANRKERFDNIMLEHLRQLFLKEYILPKGYCLMELVNGEVIRSHEQWISDWKLGDLRHLAITNMIQMDIDPVVIMEFSGHDDMASLASYYTNESSFSMCRTLYQASIEKIGNKVEKKELEWYSRETQVPVLGGWCHAGLDWEMKVSKICCKYSLCSDGCPYYECKIQKDNNEIIRERMLHFIDCVVGNKYEEAINALREVQRRL